MSLSRLLRFHFFSRGRTKLQLKRLATDCQCRSRTLVRSIRPQNPHPYNRKERFNIRPLK